MTKFAMLTNVYLTEAVSSLMNPNEKILGNSTRPTRPSQNMIPNTNNICSMAQKEDFAKRKNYAVVWVGLFLVFIFKMALDSEVFCVVFAFNNSMFTIRHFVFGLLCGLFTI